MRVLFVGLALVAASSLRAQRPDSARVAQIMTSASAERSVVPNLATLSARFTASGRTEADAGARLAARTDSIRRALGTLGIPKDSLPNRARWWWWPGRISSSVSSKCVPVPHKPTEPDHCEMRNDTTYVATDAIEIRIHDLTRVGAVIDTLMGRKVVDMSEIEFTATDVSAARLEALREATQRARAQAETIAAAEGLALGRVLSLSTEAPDDGYREPFFDFRGVSASTGAVRGGQATEIVQPNVTVSASVYCRWELVKKAQ